jgi:hypothetical protein
MRRSRVACHQSVRRCAFALWLALTLGPAAQPRTDELKFAWAVGALTGPANARQSVQVKNEITLKTGDELKVFFNRITPSFAYVLHEDAKRDFTMLYPEGQLPAKFAPSTGSHYIPAEPDWFELDGETGIERLYLIASATPLTALEKLLSDYEAAKPADRSAIRRQIYLEMARFEKQPASAPWSERPVTMGGQVRGPKPLPKPDIALGATEVTASGYFSRVLIINHQ